MDVYLDAAFFPAIEELSFKQEGHRLELEGDATNPRLAYKGVVYNEMKGAMSSPDQVMGRGLLNALYPDTTYGFNSGGEPAEIPALTYRQLKEFHARHYHPSNAYFYTYGDLPLAERLAFIEDRVLRYFSRIDPGTDVPSQPRWSAPKTVTYSYPLDKSEDPVKKYQTCLAWLLGDIKDTYEMLVAVILEQVLIGNAASPLRKALMDSGLGTALSDGTGFDGENRDTLFAVGLKDVTESDAETIEKMILDVLKGLASDGIDRQMVESAIHQIEFHRKEITNTPYPYGIKLLIGIAASWMHGGDPRRMLQLDEDLERIQAALADDRYLENKLGELFLNNPHRVRFTLMPDQEMAEKENLRVAKELADRLAGLSPAELTRIQEDTVALRKLQETQEDLSSLPTLEREDIPASVTCMASSPDLSRPPVWAYDQSTSGIFYCSGGLGAGRIDNALLPLVPLFCYAVSKMGTETCDYSQMARRIDLYTGGIGFSANARTRFDDNRACLPFISFTAKSLARNQQKMFDILHELTSQVDFANHQRLHQLVLEYRSGLESSVVHNGHRLAISLASRAFTPTNRLHETWGGIHQLQQIKQIEKEIAEDGVEALATSLRAIGQTLFCQPNIKLALIGDSAMLSMRQPNRSRGLWMAWAATARKDSFLPILTWDKARRLKDGSPRRPSLLLPKPFPSFNWGIRTAPPCRLSPNCSAPCSCTGKFAKKGVPTAVLHCIMRKTVCSVSPLTGIPTLWPRSRLSTGPGISSAQAITPRRTSRKRCCKSARKSTSRTLRGLPPARPFTAS